MKIDDYVEQRNNLLFQAESVSEEAGNSCWVELGVANRHIERVVNGTFPLRFVENEIVRCLQRVEADSRFHMKEPEA